MFQLDVICIVICFITAVLSQSCPYDTNVVQMCSRGEYTGARVMIDMSSYTENVSNCSCTFNTTANRLRISTVTAPNFPQCNSAIRFFSTAGGTIRFQCLMSGTFVDTTEFKDGRTTLETYGATYDKNYCLVIENAEETLETVQVTCTSSPLNPYETGFDANNYSFDTNLDSLHQGSSNTTDSLVTNTTDIPTAGEYSNNNQYFDNSPNKLSVPPYDTAPGLAYQSSTAAPNFNVVDLQSSAATKPDFLSTTALPLYTTPKDLFMIASTNGKSNGYTTVDTLKETADIITETIAETTLAPTQRQSTSSDGINNYNSAANDSGIRLRLEDIKYTTETLPDLYGLNIRPESIAPSVDMRAETVNSSASDVLNETMFEPVASEPVYTDNIANLNNFNDTMFEPIARGPIHTDNIANLNKLNDTMASEPVYSETIANLNSLNDTMFEPIASEPVHTDNIANSNIHNDTMFEPVASEPVHINNMASLNNINDTMFEPIASEPVHTDNIATLNNVNDTIFEPIASESVYTDNMASLNNINDTMFEPIASEPVHTDNIATLNNVNDTMFEPIASESVYTDTIATLNNANDTMYEPMANAPVYSEAIPTSNNADVNNSFADVPGNETAVFVPTYEGSEARIIDVPTLENVTESVSGIVMSTESVIPSVHSVNSVTRDREGLDSMAPVYSADVNSIPGDNVYNSNLTLPEYPETANSTSNLNTKNSMFLEPNASSSVGYLPEPDVVSSLNASPELQSDTTSKTVAEPDVVSSLNASPELQSDTTSKTVAEPDVVSSLNASPELQSDTTSKTVTEPDVVSSLNASPELQSDTTSKTVAEAEGTTPADPGAMNYKDPFDSAGPGISIKALEPAQIETTATPTEVAPAIFGERTTETTRMINERMAQNAPDHIVPMHAGNTESGNFDMTMLSENSDLFNTQENATNTNSEIIKQASTTVSSHQTMKDEATVRPSTPSSLLDTTGFSNTGAIDMAISLSKNTPREIAEASLPKEMFPMEIEVTSKQPVPPEGLQSGDMLPREHEVSSKQPIPSKELTPSEMIPIENEVTSKPLVPFNDSIPAEMVPLENVITSRQQLSPNDLMPEEMIPMENEVTSKQPTPPKDSIPAENIQTENELTSNQSVLPNELIPAEISPMENEVTSKQPVPNKELQPAEMNPIINEVTSKQPVPVKEMIPVESIPVDNEATSKQPVPPKGLTPAETMPVENEVTSKQPVPPQDQSSMKVPAKKTTMLPDIVPGDIDKQRNIPTLAPVPVKPTKLTTTAEQKVYAIVDSPPDFSNGSANVDAIKNTAKSKEGENMNVSLNGEMKGRLFDMDNKTYIIVVGAIAGLVVLAAVLGIIIHHSRQHRSAKADISAGEGGGPEALSHKNLAYDSGDVDAEKGTNGVSSSNGSGPAGASSLKHASGYNGTIEA